MGAGKYLSTPLLLRICYTIYLMLTNGDTSPLSLFNPGFHTGSKLVYHQLYSLYSMLYRLRYVLSSIILIPFFKESERCDVGS